MKKLHQIIEVNGLYGFANSHGDIVVEPIYKKIVYVYNDVYAIYLDTWEFVDSNGEQVNFPNNVIRYTTSDDKALNGSIHHLKRYKNISIDKHGILVLENPITSIRARLLVDCNNLTEISLPKTLTEIHAGAFNGCHALKKVNIEDLSAWLKIDFHHNPLNYGADLYLNGTLLTSLVIPSDIKRIKGRAFSGCTSLKEVTIHENVLSIGTGAFRKCKSIGRVCISDLSAWLKMDLYDTPLRYGADLYLNQIKVEELVTPVSTTKIKESAFLGCTSLKSVIIHNGVTEIGRNAFCGCCNLISVTIPDSITSIGEAAFIRCSALACFYGKYSSGDNRFQIVNGRLIGCAPSGLTEVVIPNEVDSIGERAFYGCSNLLKICINQNVRHIGREAFSGCVGELVINSDIVEGRDSFFYEDASNLSQFSVLVFGERVSKIGESSFCNISSVKKLIFSNSITHIGRRAFENCSLLEEVQLGCGITTIGDDAFKDCGSLKKVCIADLPSWCKISFSNNFANPLANKVKLYFGECEVEHVYTGSITEIKPYSFIGCSSLKSVTISDNTTSLGTMAFYNCSSLNRVAIGRNLNTIGECAFEENAIKNVDIVDISTWYTVKFKNWSANPLHKGATLYANNQMVVDVVIPNDISTIHPYAFIGCSSLKSVIAHDNILWIGEGAFGYCESLINIRLPQNLKSIEKGSFIGCISLNTISIPTNVETIKMAAFSGCASLSRVFTHDNISNLEDGVFANCSKLTEIAIPQKVSYIAPCLCYNCTSLTHVVLSNNIEHIGESAFGGCTSLKNVTIPSKVEYIDERAFEGCKNLQNVIIEKDCKIVSISRNAFIDCQNLNETSLIVIRSLYRTEDEENDYYYPNYQEDEYDNSRCDDNYSDGDDYAGDTWAAMTDGMYGDMPDDFDGDYSFLGR